MNLIPLLFHGTSSFKFSSIPSLHTRTRGQRVIFKDLSFHASCQKWIALAYTYTPAKVKVGHCEIALNVGVDLYKNRKEVEIHGVYDLEFSLSMLYGKGGYLLTFQDCCFTRKRGLGTLELITQKEQLPLSIQFIKNPIDELKALGVNFTFTDLTKRSYKSQTLAG